MLLTSPQPLPGDEFKPRYAQKCVLGPQCENMVIRPQTPWKLENFVFFCRHWNMLTNKLTTSPQPLSGDDFKPIYTQTSVLGPQYPNMVIRPQTPDIGKL